MEAPYQGNSFLLLQRRLTKNIFRNLRIELDACNYEIGAFAIFEHAL